MLLVTCKTSPSESGDIGSRAQEGHSLVSGCGDNGGRVDDSVGCLEALRVSSGGEKNGDFEAPKLLLRRLALGRNGLAVIPKGDTEWRCERVDNGLKRQEVSTSSSIEKLCSSEKRGFS